MRDEEEVVLSAAARELGVSHVTIWRHVQAGKLKARKVGPIYLVKRADLDAFKAARRGPGRPRNDDT
jgi:excisionase family DNA binding protein